MSRSNKYGHLSRAKKGNNVWRWAIALAVCLWGVAVCVWNTGRMAALFGYHPALGSPLFTVGEYRLYWPWKLVEWAERFQQYEQVTRIVDQTYLMGAGLPLVLFIIYMASQQGLKGRDDLHGSAKWAERKDIDKMGYLKSDGVYVGGWYDEKAKIHYYLRHNGPEHILCFAPTRSGKGVGLILPTLLAWEHSSVVLDIKGENYALTTGYLKSLGHKILRFDPSDSEGASAAFNPLEEIRLNSPLSIPDVQQISMMVMDPGTKRPARDSRGRALPDSLLKEGIIPNGSALLLSQEHDGGFDSRHFGLIPLSALYKVKPIITKENKHDYSA